MKKQRFMSSRVSKALQHLLVLSSLTLGLGGCGQKALQKSSDDASITGKQQAKSATGLALSLPANLPVQINQVNVTLTEYQMALGVPCSINPVTGVEDCPKLPPPWTKIYKFTTKDKAIAITDLVPTDYNITVDLLDSVTNKVYEHGEGLVTIEAAKTANANISLANVSANTGELVITLDQNQGGTTAIPGGSSSTPPSTNAGIPPSTTGSGTPGSGICQPVGSQPSCVQSGGTYSWKTIKPSGSNFCGEELAKGSKIVDSVSCFGLAFQQVTNLHGG